MRSRIHTWCAIAFCFLLLFSVTHAAPPATLGYQGFLKQSGTAVNGSRSMTFNLFSASTGGVSAWNETQTVTVNDGYFSVSLGSTTPFPTSVNFNTTAYYLEVTVDGTTLTPRQRFDAVPYARVTQGVQSAATAPTVATAGGVYFNTTDNTLYVSNGTSWAPLSSSGGAGTFTTATSTGNTTLATGASTTNTFGTGAGATNTIGNATGTNQVQGATTFTSAVTFSALPTIPLTAGQILVGNGTNSAAAAALNGDATLSSLGVLTVSAGAISTTKIADTSVTLAKLAADSVNSAKIVDGSVTNSDLQNSSFTTSIGTTGTDINVSGSPTSLGGTLTLNIPTASSLNRGALSTTDWAAFNAKVGSARSIATGTGLSGGGDLSADRTLSLDINGLTAKTTALMADAIPVYDSATSSIKKITRSDFLQGLTGALTYQGTYNAATNTPALTDGTGATGQMRVVTTGGTQDFGSGSLTLAVGDFVIHNGTAWQVAPSSSAVTSVFARTGAITAQSGDYTATQITNTAAGGIAATTVQAALNELDGEKLSTSLTNGSLLIGNGSNLAAAVALSGDATVTNAGVLTISNDAITASKILDGTIGNADISNSAAIAYSKLALGSSVVSADITDGTLTNADINAAAAIAYSKLNLANSITTGDIVDGTITNADLSNATITLATGTTGTDINVSGSPVSLGGTVTVNIPSASAAARGLLTSTDWSAFHAKVATTRSIAAGAGLVGGGDLSANRTLALDINSLTADGVANNADQIAVYDADTASVRKIARSTLLSGVTGALVYQGTWNASTNTPTLSNGTGTQGRYYVVATGGSQDLGSGSITFAAGDWVVHNGTAYEKLINSVAVSSVFSRTGAITAQSGDYTATQITNTAAGGIAATTVQAALNELDSEKLATALVTGSIWIGNGSNVANSQVLSGDATLTNAGVLTLAAGSVTTGKILDGEIVNADINAAANIALSKIAGGSNIVTSLTTPTGSNANGGSITSNVLTLSLADATNPGLVGTGTQTFAGDKTFTGNTTIANNTTGGTLLSLTGNSLTSGKALSLASAATAFTGSVADITLSGNNAANTGNLLALNVTGSSSAARGLLVLNAGTGLSADIQGAIATRAGTTYTTAGSANDVAFGNASYIRLDTSGAAQTITGIAGGVDGRLLTLTNADAGNTVTLTNNDASSVAANRIITGTGASLTLAVGASVGLIYDAVDSKWRVVGGTGGSGGGGASFSSADVSNLASGGAIGSAAATVDTYTNFNVNQTTAGQSVTLPNPTNTTGTKGKIVTINNTGSANFTIGGVTIPAGSYGSAFVWTGSQWNPLNAASNVAASYLSAGLSTNYDPANGNFIGWNTNVNSAGDDITLVTGSTIGNSDTSRGIFTLKAGKTYRLRAAVAWTDGSGNTILGRWQTVSGTTGTDISSAAGGSNQNSGGTIRENSVAEVIYTPSVETKVGFKMSGSDPVSVYAQSSWATVEVIAGNTPVTGQMVDYASGTWANNTASYNNLTGSQGNLTVSGGYVTLKAGKTYRLYASAETGMSGANTYSNSYWVTSGGTQLGPKGEFLSVQGGYNEGSNDSFSALYTPTVDTQVGIYNSHTNGTVSNTSSHWEIIQIGSTATTEHQNNALSNFAADGYILGGTASSPTVSQYTNFYSVNQTTTGRTLSINNPNNTALSRIVYIHNTGSANFTMHSVTVGAGESAAFVWNGTTWKSFGNQAGNVAAEYGENNAITHAQTTTSSTFVDVAGGSIPLPSAGTWEVTPYITYDNTGNNYGHFRITDNSGTAVQYSTFDGTTSGTVANLPRTATTKVFITTTSAATYKLQWYAGSGTMRILNQASTGNTAPSESKITWKKISGYVPVSGQTVEYTEVKTTDGAGFTNGSYMDFASVVAGNMTVDTTADTIALSAGKTYRMIAMIRGYGGSSPVEYGFVDATSGTELVANTGRGMLQGNSSAEHPFMQAELIYTPSSNQNVKVRAVTGSGTYSYEARISRVVIQQIGSSAATSSAFSILSNALATNVLDNTNYAQTWNWSTASTQTGLLLTADALTTGALLSLDADGAANTALALNVGGAYATKKGTDYSTTGTTNDVNFGATSLVRLTGASAQTITGIAGGIDGERLTIINAAAQSATLSNQSTASVAANRILTGTGADLTIAADASVQLVYDSGSSRWRVVGGTGGGSSGSTSVALDSDSTFLTFTGSPTAAQVAEVAYVANQDVADRVAASYVQALTSYFAATENDTHFDQELGNTNMASIISTLPNNAAWSFAVVDMDNAYSTGAGPASTSNTEYYRVIIGSDGTNIYYFNYTFSNSLDGTGYASKFFSSYTTTRNDTTAPAIVSATPLAAPKTISSTSMPTVSGAFPGLLRVSTIGVTRPYLSAAVSASQQVEYVSARLASSTSVANNAAIPFTTVTGTIPNSSGVFTLTAGKTYRLQGAGTYTGAQGSSNIQYQWRDITNNALLGTGGLVFSTDGATQAGNNQIAEAVITPTTNITVRLENMSGATREFQGASGALTHSTWATITQLGSTAATGVTMNSLTSALSSNSLDNAAFDQTWNWSTATTQNLLSLSGNALTSGTLLNLTSSTTAFTSGGLLNITHSGVPASSWTGNLAKIEATGASTANLDGTLLRVGYTGAAGGSDGTVLNLTTSQTGGSALIFRANDDGTYTDSTPFVINADGRVGIGISDPLTNLAIGDNDTGLNWNGDGNISIRTNGGNRITASTGNGTQTATYDGDNNWDFSSDERVKTDINPLGSMLEKINAVNFVNYRYTDSPSTKMSIGVLAQQIQPIFPELVTVGEFDERINDNLLRVALTDFGIIAAKGVQELNFKVETGKMRVSETELDEWTASGAITTRIDAIVVEPKRSARSYIYDIFNSGFKVVTDFVAERVTALNGYFTHIFADKATTKELCVGEGEEVTCITKAQLDALLGGTLTTPGTEGGAAGGSDSTTLTIAVNGAPEQTVTVGAAWSDLGATAANHVGEIMVSVDGATEVIAGSATIDTAVVGTYTLVYTATNESEETVTATRTVIVTESEVPPPTPEPVPAPEPTPEPTPEPETTGEASPAENQ